MGRRLTQEEAIAVFNSRHGFCYDYSLSVYKGALEPIDVLCPKHGVFTIIANNHKIGFGCKKCRREEILKPIFDEFNRVHQHKYDYSQTKYVADNKRIVIICPEHGAFLKLPSSHLKGSGCNQCQRVKRNTSNLIESFKEIHGKRYDYSLVEFVSSKEKVTIICKDHGEFKQNIYKHLDYQGCPKCARNFKKA